MGLPSVLLSPNSKKKKKKKKKSTGKNYYISGNGFSYFLKKKLFLYFTKLNFFRFQGTETPKKFLIFWKMETQKFFIFQETKISYISVYGTFLYFRKCIIRTLTYLEQEAYLEHWYIENSSIFRTRSIFTTLVYSES